jgi:GNAT superfamily N-acetyltransferase
VAYSAPEPLERRHSLDGFDSGERSLDEWLKRFALATQGSGSARVFVTSSDGETVAGYYALAAAQIEPASAGARATRGEPVERPLPAVLLARLAVDRIHQGKDLGRSLLQDALLRCLQAADSVGIRLILVHALNERARAFYERFGFEPSPSDPLHLLMLAKDLRRYLDRS